MAVRNQQELRNSIDSAAQAGEQFSQLYYEMFDKRRHKVPKLYSASSTVVWNGNVINGDLEKLMDFYTNLPSSEHTLYSLDCQPVTENAIPGRNTILIVVEGCVKFEGHKSENFSQNFLLTVEGSSEGGQVWRVASDCFRFIE
ncbi:NTF2-related export protein 1 [Exaiptasia diaphana]|uniref:NTF2-related export protein n=1 Tax=Exaiptasia diaphana TaxID=2652724 RepID=A0A913XEJ9_EXADI|nr:NTF2-related export protein 1 [Exaiptasia diaphana]KXJ12559.1 NTF2-related export protein 2 [Exaiptasia diaphana]